MSCPICHGTLIEDRVSIIGVDPVWHPITYRRAVVCGYCPEGKAQGGRISEGMELRLTRRVVTEAERADILRGVEMGLTHQQIARALRWSVDAIDTHRQAMRREAA